MNRKPYELFISGKFPLLKTIMATSLDDALRMIKATEAEIGADWDMYPLFEGEKRVITQVKFSDGQKRRVVISNPDFK